jgi:hypothetical protein
MARENPSYHCVLGFELGFEDFPTQYIFQNEGWAQALLADLASRVSYKLREEADAVKCAVDFKVATE